MTSKPTAAEVLDSFRIHLDIYQKARFVRKDGWVLGNNACDKVVEALTLLDKVERGAVLAEWVHVQAKDLMPNSLTSDPSVVHEIVVHDDGRLTVWCDGGDSYVLPKFFDSGEVKVMKFTNAKGDSTFDISATKQEEKSDE